MNKGQEAISAFINSFKLEYNLKKDLLVDLSHFKSLEKQLNFNLYKKPNKYTKPKLKYLSNDNFKILA